MAAFFLGIGAAALLNLHHPGYRFGLGAACLPGFLTTSVCGVAAVRRQPMLKVMDDRFSVFTPFGYAMVRFGEVLAFRRRGLPGLRTLRVDVNRSARPRFPSGMGRFLYCLAWMSPANAVAIQGYMLGADLESVINMLEKRRIAAVRLDAATGYDPAFVAPLG